MLSKNTMSFVEAKDRMLSKLRQKTAAIGHSGDLAIADFRVIDNDNAVLLVEYDKELGPVNGENLSNFVARSFDGQLHAELGTAKVYPALGGMSVVVSRPNDTRPYKDSAELVAVVANTMFLDEDLGETWEVQSDSEGNKYLKRVREDSIREIIESRKNRMMVKSSTNSMLTFANALSANVENLCPGDEIRYYKDGQHYVGIVSAVSKKSITVKSPDEKETNTISPEAVVELVSRGPEYKKHEDEFLKDFFRRAYGFDDDLAEKMVNP